MDKAIVYFTKDISPKGLVKIYRALGINLNGKVGVKISTGELGGHNYLKPELIGDLVDHLEGTIIECCTAYGGSRQDVSKHWDTIKEHGFLPRFNVDILDEFGEFSIPVYGGKHLTYDTIGEHCKHYDSILILSHFKGHVMGGFGGALKNISIGLASTAGKLNIHSAGGENQEQSYVWSHLPPQDDFLESMADACKAVLAYYGSRNMAYINVANRLSVDCDCDSNPHEPEMCDIGIFASLDPVAIDQACYDAVKNSDDPGKAALIERMDSRHGIHTVETAAEHGLGVREYDLVCID